MGLSDSNRSAPRSMMMTLYQMISKKHPSETKVWMECAVVTISSCVALGAGLGASGHGEVLYMMLMLPLVYVCVAYYAGQAKKVSSDQ